MWLPRPSCTRQLHQTQIMPDNRKWGAPGATTSVTHEYRILPNLQMIQARTMEQQTDWRPAWLLAHNSGRGEVKDAPHHLLSSVYSTPPPSVSWSQVALSVGNMCDCGLLNHSLTSATTETPNSKVGAPRKLIGSLRYHAALLPRAEVINGSSETFHPITYRCGSEVLCVLPITRQQSSLRCRKIIVRVIMRRFSALVNTFNPSNGSNEYNAASAYVTTRFIRVALIWVYQDLTICSVELPNMHQY